MQLHHVAGQRILLTLRLIHHLCLLHLLNSLHWVLDLFLGVGGEVDLRRYYINGHRLAPLSIMGNLI